MKKVVIFFANLLVFSQLVKAQSVTIAPTNPASPTAGTVVFDNNTSLLKYWNGNAWIDLTNAAAASGWITSGNNLYNANTANVGIGTTNPVSKLQIGSVGNSGYASNHIAFGNGTDASGISQNASTGTVNWFSTTNISLFPQNGNGKVGIGTSSPNATLDVYGDGAFSGNSISYNSLLHSYLGGGLSVSANSGLQFSSLLFDGSSVQAQSGTAGNIGASAFLLNPFGGNVGVGTTSPTYKFTINSGAVSNWGLVHTNGTVVLGSFIYSNGVAEFGTRSNHPLYFFTNNSDAPPSMALATNGNVGIGTTNPTYKLAVNGTIRAKEVIVETNWADFVFEKNYVLPKLKEVEKFISENHHLPEMPSAAEIQQNGAKLAELTTKMMQKLEEQTLYIIELQKQIDELKSLKNENYK